MQWSLPKDQLVGQPDVVTRLIQLVLIFSTGLTYVFGPSRWKTNASWDNLKRLSYHDIHVTIAWYGVLLLIGGVTLLAGWALDRANVRMVGFVFGAVSYSTMTLVLAINFRWSGIAPPSAIIVYGCLASWLWQSAYRVSFIEDDPWTWRRQK